MEVANASMYDGSTGTGEAVLMAHRVTKRRKAVLSGGLHPHYAEVVETLSRHGRATTVVALPPDVARHRGHPRRDRRRRPPASSCRRRTSSATCATSQPIAEKAHRHGALLDRRVHRGGVARPRRAAGRDGRRHRRRRGPVDRQRAEFRRALCRPLRHAAEISSARCRAGCAARRSMRRASAASC